MTRTGHYLSLIAIFFIAFSGSLLPVEMTSVYAQSHISKSKISDIKAELMKSGKSLKSETIESLMDKREFQGLKPEEIIKGKELLNNIEPDEQLSVETEVSELPEMTKDVSTVDDPVSLFNRYRDYEDYEPDTKDLKPFGYGVFQLSNQKSLIPQKDIPVSPDYIIGPGDEIRILLWGRINADYDLIVDRDGNITVPQIGPLKVNGMEFQEMKTFLAKQADQIVGANINITMGSLKSIHVFVLGDVKKPGSYTLNSFSTISGALITSGGPSDIGSIRDIQLKRKGETIESLDFYDFLLKGDKSKDRVLQSGDVVFIPTSGPLVGIAGNVKRPAIYELKEDNDLFSLFQMAGGVIPSAYTHQIQVERIEINSREIIIDIDDKNLTKSKNILLQDGDLVKVFPIVDVDVNAIFLAGNIKRPGKYEYKPDMRVKDLISSTADLLKNTYFDYALIKRQQSADQNEELLPFNLGKLIINNDESNNIALEPRDRIYIFPKSFFADIPYISVAGEVRSEGEFELLKNYRVKDSILEAGGLTRDASLHLGEIYRTDEQGQVKQIYFNVGLAMSEDSKDNILLVKRDKVLIHSLWEKQYKNMVTINGDITNPGEYTLAENMRLRDLLFASGNTLESAYLEETEIASFNIVDGKSVIMENKTVNLREALQNDPDHNLLLKPHDSVFVKRIPDWSKKRYVTLSGEFKFPGTYIISKGETISSVINRAGGFSDRAYLRGSIFKRESIRKKQQQNINEMIERLERELLTEGSVQASVAVDANEVAVKKEKHDQQEKFIKSLRKTKATGRMSIKMAHPRLLKGSEYDIALEHNDNLHMPVKNSVVNVTGAVMSQGSFIYSDKLDYKDYIEMTGGYAKYADKKNMYVLKVDGSAMRLPKGSTRWSESRSRWELTSFSEDIKDIEPGDTIVVPEKLDRTAWLRYTQTLTSILYQIAVTAGVVIVLF